MPSNRVFIIGGAQTDFARNWYREKLEISDVLADSFEKALVACKVDLKDIESLHVGNFVADLFCGQGLLGGLLVNLFPELSGIPSSRHEAACASGSMAIFAAMREIELGLYDLVAVSGVEVMRNVDGQTASEYLGAAAWVGHEATTARYPWVHLFSRIKEHYREQFGLKDEHLAEIAKVNYKNARRNPNAQTRSWTLTEEYFAANDSTNPIVEGLLRKSDCGRITDGSATIFLASERFASQYAKEHNLALERIPYIKGWGHKTAPITLAYKLEQSTKTEYPFPHLKAAIEDALSGAKIASASQLDAIETHDCFTISEYVAIEHFGLTGPGEAWKRIEDNTIDFNGSLPFNPSGGLIACGHPVGATGVRMMLDAYKQVAVKAEDYQLAECKNVGILNIGGSFTTVASFVVGI